MGQDFKITFQIVPNYIMNHYAEFEIDRSSLTILTNQKITKFKNEMIFWSEYRVASLSKWYIIAKGIIIPSLKSIGKF